jgi:hypothetical protein
MVPDTFFFPTGSDPRADSAGAEGRGRGAGGGSDRFDGRAVQPDWESARGGAVEPARWLCGSFGPEGASRVPVGEGSPPSRGGATPDLCALAGALCEVRGGRFGGSLSNARVCLVSLVDPNQRNQKD